MNKRKPVRLGKAAQVALSYVALCAIAAVTLFPFFWMVSTSLKEPGNILSLQPQLIPSPARWANYIDAWTAQPFGRYYINSIVVAVSVTLGQLLTCSLAGYAFARLRFVGRNVLFFCYLSTLMIPSQVTMIPVFIILRYFGWLNTYQALILPSVCSAYGTFLLRQFFKTIPKDLEDAATIDRCSQFGIYLHIMLPLAKPALATLATFVLLQSWNDFFWPLIVCHTPEMMTLPIGLSNFQGMYSTSWELLMAAAVIVMVPVVALYIINQRFFTRGIVLTGLKG
jgi:multiple sugar transport system permease protein